MILPILAPSPEPYVLVSSPEARPEYAVPGTPFGVTVDRAGVGRVWRYARPSRLLATFRVAPVYAGVSGNVEIQAPIVRSSDGGGRAVIVNDGATTPGFQAVETRPFRSLFRRSDGRDIPEQALWTPDGRTLLLPRQNGGTLALDSAGRVRAALPMDPPFAFQGGRAFGLDGRGFVIVDLATLRTVRHLAVRTAEPPFAVSPDGRWIVAGGRDRSGVHYRYHVWRVADGREMAEILGDGLAANSPLDPRFLGSDRVALYARGEVRAVPSGRLLRRIPEGDTSFGPVVFDPAHPLTPIRATFPATPEGTRRVWDLPDGRLIAPGGRRTLVLDPHVRRLWTLPQFPTNGVRQVVRRADGSVVINGLNGVRILDPTLRTARFVHQPEAEGLFGAFDSVLAPDGLTAVRDGLTSVRWRVDDGKVLGPADAVPLGRDEVVAPDGARYRYFSPTGVVERVGGWSHKGPGYLGSELSFTADGSRIAFVEEAPRNQGAPHLRVLDARTGASIVDVPATVAIDAILAPDGSRAAFFRDNEVEVRSLQGAPSVSIQARMPAYGELRWWGLHRLLLSGATLQVLDPDAGRLLSTWAAWDDGAWTAWTPSGAVDGNAGGFARIVRPGERPSPVGAATRREEVWRTLRERQAPSNEIGSRRVR